VNYWIIVPAAGAGRRFGSETPKQYLPLLESTVIQCTLDRLSQLENVSKIVVPINPDDLQAQTFTYQSPEKLQFVAGGVERSDSVLAGLNAIRDKAQDDDWVLVHDVARPCVRLSDIRHLIDTLAEDEVGGLLANQVRDTIKQTAAHHFRVGTTIPRNNLWKALTPQMFRFGLLHQALTRAKRYKVSVTDESSAIEALGYQPMLVLGAYDNLKITYPEDLALADYLLRQQA
jgi:2-C-methyl-D-erythritol 4-phosphate cytidylyltransferase